VHVTFSMRMPVGVFVAVVVVRMPVFVLVSVVRMWFVGMSMPLLFMDVLMRVAVMSVFTVHMAMPMYVRVLVFFFHK